MKLNKFDNALIIVGNLGELKIYKAKEELDITRQDDFHTSHKHHKGKIVEHLNFQELCDEAFIDAHKKISEIVTDKQGHFEGAFGGESGDGPKIELELENRIIKLITEHINTVLAKEEYDKWYFAFPKEHFGRIFNAIDDRFKNKLAKSLEENLVKKSPQEIVEEFSN